MKNVDHVDAPFEIYKSNKFYQILSNDTQQTNFYMLLVTIISLPKITWLSVSDQIRLTGTPAVVIWS